MKEILIVTIGFSPNIGGIETHFDDLVKELDKKNWKVWVITYKPITTRIKAKIYEKKGRNILILRIPWIRGLFYKLIKSPVLEFSFYLPGLLLTLPLFILIKGKNIKTIHSHGLIAGFVSVFWGKLFNKKVIVTTHSIYNFPKKGAYLKLVKWIFSKSDAVLTLSKQSKKEILSLGIEEKKVKVFTYWVDLTKFKNNITKLEARKRLKWQNKFTILFVGRLVEEKGILVLLDAAKKWNKNINLVIIGLGPLEALIKKKIKGENNIFYVGKVDNDLLPLYYNASDLVVVPSIHEEGFGRVILESLASAVPVIGSRRGAIPEAMNERVGMLIDITPENIKVSAERLFNDRLFLEKLCKSARKYAEIKFSVNNITEIINCYE